MARVDKAMDALKVLMEKTDRVRLVSPGTDIEFSIKGSGHQVRREDECSGWGNLRLLSSTASTAPSPSTPQL